MRTAHIPALALGIPAVGLAIAMLALLATAVVGSHPLWQQPALNMSEAAALRDAATVARRLRDGENPDQPRQVRAGLLTTRDLSLTPLDAALAARRPDVVELLLSTLPRDDVSRWTRTKCLATSLSDADLARVVDRYRPASLSSTGDPDCSDVVPAW